jgi:hypothetical protein
MTVAADLPPAGVAIPCSAYSENAALKLNALGVLTLDFKGDIDFYVRTSSTDGVVMDVQAFRMEADTSPSTPGSGSVVALTLSETVPTPHSVLSTAESGGLELLINLSLTLTVTDKATNEEVLRASTDPTKHATLRAGDVNQFPPVNQPYKLQDLVQLYPDGGSAANGDEPMGELQHFDGILDQRDTPQ